MTERQITPREKQVVYLMWKEKIFSMKEVGARMGISPNTVKALIRNARLRTGLKDISQMYAVAFSGAYYDEFVPGVLETTRFHSAPAQPVSLELTTLQTSLVRHALGLSAYNKRSFRNHFVTGVGPDFDAWFDLVQRGLAHRREGTELSGGDYTFWATRALATAVLREDEQLSGEFRE